MAESLKFDQDVDQSDPVRPLTHPHHTSWMR